MNKYGKGICPHCGKEFERKSGSHIFCSEECWKGNQRAVRDRVDAELYRGGEDACCKWCGKWFKRPYKSKKYYCSNECKYKAMTASEEEKRRRRRKPKKVSKAGIKDGFTWDDIRQVLGEYGISSYHKAVRVLEERRRERLSH